MKKQIISVFILMFSANVFSYELVVKEESGLELENSKSIIKFAAQSGFVAKAFKVLDKIKEEGYISKYEKKHNDSLKIKLEKYKYNLIQGGVRMTIEAVGGKYSVNITGQNTISDYVSAVKSGIDSLSAKDTTRIVQAFLDGSENFGNAQTDINKN